MKVKTLVIDRAKWGTGALRNDDGTQCCLGFLARRVGCKVKEILDRGMPYDQYEIADRFKTAGFDDEADWFQTAATINDSLSRPRREKEKQLRALFAEHGIKLTFTGRSPR